MGAAGSLTARTSAPELAVALAVAAFAAFAPPATAAGVGLTAIAALLAARLDLPRALALGWGLAVVPIYLDFRVATFPAHLVIASILFTRIFLLERRPLSFPGRLEWLLFGLVVVAGVTSAALSDERVLSAYYLLHLLLFLLYIPAARAVYTDRRTIAPSLTVLLIALMVQAGVGLAQFLFGIDFALGLLASPVTPAFMLRGALEAKLLTQDYNWIGFGRALPSGLVINSIVYGVFLATGGMILVAVPASWLPNGRAGVWRAGGVLALLVAFGSFKLTAWLGILAGAVVFMLLRIPDPRTRWRALVIPPLVLVVLGFIFQDAIEQRLLDIARGSLFTRLLSWFTYARNIRHGGLIGVGLGRASLLAPSVSTVAGGQQTTMELAPESSPIGLAAEIGIPGMLALYLLFVSLVVRGGGRRPTWAWPAMVTVLVGNLAVYGLPEEHTLPLVALLAGLAASRGAREG
jgi:hypothetical protein